MKYKDKGRGNTETISIQTVYEIIGGINDFYKEETKKFDEFILELHSNGDGIIILFSGDRIWYSEEDCRLDIHDGKESLETYILRNIKQHINILRDIFK